jgi:hypothetical protein
MNRADRRRFLDRVAQIGCLITGAPAEIHHVRKGGERRDDRKVVPLSPLLHRTGPRGIAIESGKKSWRENFCNEVDLVAKVYSVLGIFPDPDVEGWISRYGSEQDIDLHELREKFRQQMEKQANGRG